MTFSVIRSVISWIFRFAISAWLCHHTRTRILSKQLVWLPWNLVGSCIPLRGSPIIVSELKASKGSSYGRPSFCPSIMHFFHIKMTKIVFFTKLHAWNKKSKEWFGIFTIFCVQWWYSHLSMSNTLVLVNFLRINVFSFFTTTTTTPHVCDLRQFCFPNNLPDSEGYAPWTPDQPPTSNFFGVSTLL